MKFIIYQTENGYVNQISQSTSTELPKPPEGYSITEIDFYNRELCGTFYMNGIFYEDNALTNEIKEPDRYVSQQKSEPEPYDITKSQDYQAGYDQAVLDLMGV